MNELTKAPERIFATGKNLCGSWTWTVEETVKKWGFVSTEFIRADLATEQVREAREAILIALADIPHPESTDAAEALERAYRAAEVTADMQEGSVRSIKAAVNEAYERAANACAEIFDAAANLRDPGCSYAADCETAIRAMKSDDASDAHRLPVSSECNTPSPGRAVSSVAPATLTYTNYRGETSVRQITPLRVWFGATEWHPEPQWLLTGYDHDKQAERDFALKDFGPATGEHQ